VSFRVAPQNHSLGILRYHSRTATCELPDGSKETFLKDVEIPLMDSRYELQDGSTESFFRDVEITLMDSHL